MSVNEGDSVTLPTGLTEIQRYDVIQWRFGQQKTLVAEINRMAGIFNTSDGPDERFRDRLKLDNQTGSLTIMNTRTTDSGVYEADISSSRYTIHKSFSVTVSTDVMSVSVMEGDSVTLHTGLNETQRINEILLWKFGDHGELIARLNGPFNKEWSSIDLNRRTGDLIISNFKNSQYGYYKVEINTRRMILHRKYRITGSGLSPATIAGIVVGALLVVAAAAGVIYHRKKQQKRKAFIVVTSSPHSHPLCFLTELDKNPNLLLTEMEEQYEL